MRQGLADHFRSHPHRGSMIVHPERKIIYMKSAKTAGTSILRKTLEPQVGGFIHEKDEPDQFAGWLQNIDDTALGEYFIFCVVRNPWDRFSSLAAYFDIPLAQLCSDFANLCANNDALAAHALPQHIYTHLEQHEGAQTFCDLIVSFENLDAEMQPVFKRFELPVKRLTKANQSQKRHYSTNFSVVEVNWVRKHYQTDIDLFGYTFENAPKQSAFGRLMTALRRG